jgi:glucose/arabinose dehydrogenase
MGVSLSAEEVLVDRIPAAQFHDGGSLAFGPDGMLYAGTGDARQPDNAQDLGSLSGKILRLTPEGGPSL